MANQRLDELLMAAARVELIARAAAVAEAEPRVCLASDVLETFAILAGPGVALELPGRHDLLACGLDRCSSPDPRPEDGECATSDHGDDRGIDQGIHASIVADGWPA
jgi:hypothetical protein